MPIGDPVVPLPAGALQVIGVDLHGRRRPGNPRAMPSMAGSPGGWVGLPPGGRVGTGAPTEDFLLNAKDQGP